MKIAVVMLGTLVVLTLAAPGQIVAAPSNSSGCNKTPLSQSPASGAPSASESLHPITFQAEMPPAGLGLNPFKFNREIAVVSEPTPTLLGALGLASFAPRRRRA